MKANLAKVVFVGGLLFALTPWASPPVALAIGLAIGLTVSTPFRDKTRDLTKYLLQASVVFTYVTKDLDLVPPRVLPPQALVIAFSPLLDKRFVKAATDLAARRFDLVIVAVSPLRSATPSAIASSLTLADIEPAGIVTWQQAGVNE